MQIWGTHPSLILLILPLISDYLYDCWNLWEFSLLFNVSWILYSDMGTESWHQYQTAWGYRLPNLPIREVPKSILSPPFFYASWQQIPILVIGVRGGIAGLPPRPFLTPQPSRWFQGQRPWKFEQMFAKIWLKFGQHPPLSYFTAQHLPPPAELKQASNMLCKSELLKSKTLRGPSQNWEKGEEKAGE